MAIYAAYASFTFYFSALLLLLPSALIDKILPEAPTRVNASERELYPSCHTYTHARGDNKERDEKTLGIEEL